MLHFMRCRRESRVIKFPGHWSHYHDLQGHLIIYVYITFMGMIEVLFTKSVQ